MLQRNISAKLIEWKNRSHHPLVIGGMRQTGKTFSVRLFGQENYKSVIYIDLRENKTIHSAFEGDFDINRLITAISASTPGSRFVPGETLLILDEIQDCPNARSSLKYWDIDGRFDVICTGSFLGVKGFRQPYERGIPVGYEEHLVMYPLSFREFLLNYGLSEDVIHYVQNCFQNRETVEKAVHESIRTLYLEYLIVGGMPEAVNAFLTSHDVNAVRQVQNNILFSIKDDFGRYINANGETKTNEVLKLRAEACLKSLPAQISKEYKKFQYSLVDSKAHSADKADALQYLVDLGLVIKSHNLMEISSPLEGNKIEKEYKAFFSDIGLLTSQLGPESAEKILRGELGAYKGAIAENMIASALYHSGYSLYYYRGSSGAPEIDFVEALEGENTLIECKASNNKATSMKYVISKPEKYGKHPAIKISDTNVGTGNGFVTFPLYYCGFVKQNVSSAIMSRVDVATLTVPESCTVPTFHALL